MTTCRHQHKRLAESVRWIDGNCLASNYAGFDWSMINSPCPSTKHKGRRLNNSFIGAIFQWTRWRNRKRVLYFASSDEGLLKFAGITDLGGGKETKLTDFACCMAPLRAASRSPTVWRHTVTPSAHPPATTSNLAEQERLLEKLKQHGPAEHGVGAYRRRLN